MPAASSSRAEPAGDPSVFASFGRGSSPKGFGHYRGFMLGEASPFQCSDFGDATPVGHRAVNGARAEVFAYCGRNVCVCAVGEPRGARRRALAPRRPAAAVDALAPRRPAAKDLLRRREVAGRERRRRGRRRLGRGLYLVLSLRNVGTGIAVLHGWRLAPERRLRESQPPPLEELTRLTRDLYVPAGDVGFWQGTFRDPAAPEFAAAGEAIAARRPLTVDALYSDHEGGQRMISRFGMLPRDDGGWIAAAARHWNVDREDPHYQ